MAFDYHKNGYNQLVHFHNIFLKYHQKCLVWMFQRSQPKWLFVSLPVGTIDFQICVWIFTSKLDMISIFGAKIQTHLHIIRNKNETFLGNIPTWWFSTKMEKKKKMLLWRIGWKSPTPFMKSAVLFLSRSWFSITTNVSLEGRLLLL